MFLTKRVYDLPSAEDGRRILVDRLWPRGLKKEQRTIDAWLKDVAPSDQLRRWFAPDPKKWPEFVRRYHQELSKKEALLEPLLEAARTDNLTLLYAARDPEHNNAVALKMFLESMLQESK